MARRWNFLLGLVGTLPLQISAGLSGVLVPAYLIAVRHFGPEQIAPVLTYAFWPQFITYPLCILGLRWRILDARHALCIGLACIALACLFDLPSMQHWTAQNFILGQIFQGIGLPFILLPLLVLFVGDVAPPEGVYAASMFNVSRSLAGTIIIAGITTVTGQEPAIAQHRRRPRPRLLPAARRLRPCFDDGGIRQRPPRFPRPCETSFE